MLRPSRFTRIRQPAQRHGGGNRRLRFVVAVEQFHLLGGDHAGHHGVDPDSGAHSTASERVRLSTSALAAP